MNNNSIIISPVVTEKSTENQTYGQYTFLVHKGATKVDIKNAINNIYDLDVEKVRIIKVIEKIRQVGRGKILLKRKSSKKAIVQIKDRKPLDVNKFNK